VPRKFFPSRRLSLPHATLTLSFSWARTLFPVMGIFSVKSFTRAAPVLSPAFSVSFDFHSFFSVAVGFQEVSRPGLRTPLLPGGKTLSRFSSFFPLQGRCPKTHLGADLPRRNPPFPGGPLPSGCGAQSFHAVSFQCSTKVPATLFLTWIDTLPVFAAAAPDDFLTSTAWNRHPPRLGVVESPVPETSFPGQANAFPSPQTVHIYGPPHTGP